MITKGEDIIYAVRRRRLEDNINSSCFSSISIP